MGSKIDNEQLPAPLLSHCQHPCLQPVYFNVIRVEPPEGVGGYLTEWTLRKPWGVLQLRIFTLGFSSGVRWLFVRMLSRFLIATQEMDFNLSSGCSVWGCLMRTQLWRGFSNSNTGQVGVCQVNVPFISKMHVYDLLCFLQNGTEGKWFNVLWWVTFGRVWDSRKNISPHLLWKVWAVYWMLGVHPR